MNEFVNVDLYIAMCKFLGVSPKKYSILAQEDSKSEKKFPVDFQYESIESVISTPPEDRRDLRAIALAFDIANYQCPPFYGHILDLVTGDFDVFLEGVAYNYVPEGECKQTLEELIAFAERPTVEERVFSLYFLRGIQNEYVWSKSLAFCSDAVIKSDKSLEDKTKAISIIVECALQQDFKLDSYTASFVSIHKSLPNRTKSEVSRLIALGFSWLDILRMSYNLQKLVSEKGIANSYTRFNTLKSMLLKELQWMPVEWDQADKQLVLQLYRDCRLTYRIDNFANLKFWLENTDFKIECMPEPSVLAETRFALLKEEDRIKCYDTFVRNANTSIEQIRSILSEWYVNTFRTYSDRRTDVFKKVFETGSIAVELDSGIAEHLAHYFAGINSVEAYAFYKMILEEEGIYSKLLNILLTTRMTYKRAFMTDEESYALMDVSIANALKWNNLDRVRFIRNYLEFPEEPEDIPVQDFDEEEYDDLELEDDWDE